MNLTGNGGTADNVEMVETAPAPAANGAVHHGGAPLLECRGVGHEYGSGTPWASTALRDIDLVVNEGDGRADPRTQRVGQVDAGMDHGRAC